MACQHRPARSLHPGAGEPGGDRQRPVQRHEVLPDGGLAVQDGEGAADDDVVDQELGRVERDQVGDGEELVAQVGGLGPFGGGLAEAAEPVAVVLDGFVAAAVGDLLTAELGDLVAEVNDLPGGGCSRRRRGRSGRRSRPSGLPRPGCGGTGAPPTSASAPVRASSHVNYSRCRPCPPGATP